MTQSTVEFSKTNAVDAIKEAPVRVLHVDDDACFLKTAKEILEMQKAFQVETASCVDEAWEKMKKEEYDVVVSDYQMPGKDGLQFLKELREKGNSTPLVIFTGRGREEIAMKALNLGASRYFTKQGQPETVYGELAHGIRQVVDKRRSEQSFLKSEDKYRRLVETLHEGIWAIDRDSRTTFVNPRMAEILGYGMEEMNGRPLFSFMDERGVEIAKRLLERRRQGIKEQHDFEFLRKDGTRVYATLETTPITDDNGNYNGAVASVMDTTERKQAEKERQIQSEELTMILDCLPLQIWYKDKDNRLLRVNKRFAEYMGVSKRGLEGKSLSDLFPPDIARKCWEEDKEVIETGQSKIDILDRHESAQGLRFFLTSKVPCKDTDGKTIGTINFSFDITERKKAEEALRNSEERWRSLTENSPDHIMLLDLKGNILYINRTVPDLKREEVIGTSQLNYISPEWHQGAKDCFERVIETGKTGHCDTEYRTKDGEVRSFEVRIGPVFQEDRVVALISSSTDVTSQKKAEEEIRSLAKFPSENPNPVLRVARDGTVLFANAAAKPILEKERSGVGKLASVIDRQWVSDVLKSGSTKEDEVKLEDKVFSFTFAPILDGGYVNIYGIDITERKKAEEYLKESEERYRQLIEFAPDAIFTYDLSGRLLDCNRQAEVLSGFKKEEIIGRNIFTTTRGRNLIKIVPGKRTEPAEYELVSRDGSKFDIEISTFPVNRKGKVEVIAIGRDLTERKKAEETVRATRSLLQFLVESSDDAIIGKTLDGTIVSWNSGAQRIYGYSPEEAIGKSVSILVPPEIQEEVQRILDKIKIGEHVNHYNTKRVKKDHTMIDVSITVSPIKDAKGNIIGASTIARDITERKKAEESLNGTMKQLTMINEKLGVVGKLTRHDVRNKLSAVVGNTYLAKKALPNDHKALDYLRNIESACSGATRVLDFAATYESLGVEELTLVDVGRAVEEAVSLTPNLKGIKVMNECHGMTVIADSLLSQLFYNLIDNSLKYGEKAQRIRVFYKTVSADKIELVCEDDGVGIPDNMRSNLFKEGFSSGKGTGYGLFMIKRICEVYGWTIQETGKQGKGAQFTMTVPRVNIEEKENHTR